MKLLAKHLFLIGYRGTGKTTVAEVLARRLQVKCIDLDAIIEHRAGKAIREIFAEGGEDLFRQWESRCLAESIDQAATPTVISLGGGAILRETNRDKIARLGDCVWLTADPETIASRIGADQTSEDRRPALTSLSPADEIKTVLNSRVPIYRQAADFEISTDDYNPDQIADAIIEWLGDTKAPEVPQKRITE